VLRCSSNESNEFGEIFGLLVGERLRILELGVDFGHEVLEDYLELTLLEAWVLVDVFEQEMQGQLLPVDHVQWHVDLVSQVFVVSKIIFEVTLTSGRVFV